MDFLFPYSETKLKPHLKMAVQRLQIHNNKKTTALKIQKREVAPLLRENKDEKARIRAEHIIREDFHIEGLEILELSLELIHERIKQVSTSKECPPDLKEAVSSVIWATNIVDIVELKEVSNQLTKKFGTKFAEAALKNENGEVNARLYHKLTYRPPSKKLVRNYLVEIAKTYDVEWEPSSEYYVDEDFPFGSPVGSSIPMAPGSQLAGAYSRNAPSSNLEPPVPSSNSTITTSNQPAPLNNVAPHLQLNEAELAEYQQFLNNQRGNSTANPVPGSVPLSRRGPDNEDDGGASVAYIYDHEVPVVEAQVIEGTVVSIHDPVESPKANSGFFVAPANPSAARAPSATPSPPPAALPAAPVNSNASNTPAPPAETIAPAAIDPLESLQARLAALNRRTP